nr:HipA domain-containing protein [Marinomonas ushuaiensis]
MEPEDVPVHLFSSHGQVKAVKFDKLSQENKFSLAGVQMKFSMKEKDGRYNLSKDNVLGDWIVKTPSTKHKEAPANEFTAMTLASLIGVEIPEIKLVEIDQLDNLPQINLPDEKYNSGNYEQIAKILYQFSGDSLSDVQQLARRLLANILLANGDAHLKNWSLLYSDQVIPRLSPAYDIVTTSVYIEN